jgi:hypothetical protein
MQTTHISQRAQTAFLVLVIAQVAHSVEEYLFRLYEVFPPARFASGLISSDLRTGFLVLNLGLIAFGIWCYAVPVRGKLSVAIPLIWFWIVLEVLNGIGHPAASLLDRSYIPGTATAPFLLAIAIYLAIALHKSPNLRDSQL